MDIKKLFILLIFFIVTGCATSVTMTGRASPPVDPLSVKILFSEKPKCAFEELGFIQSPLTWNQNVAIERVRSKAAEIGADYLVITSVYTNAFNDATASGVAYKCGRVDREKVDVKPQ